jgi:gluconolactonase
MKRIAIFPLFLFFGIIAEPTMAQSLVAPGAEVVKLAGDFGFTEGPTANSKGDVYFVDDPNNKIHRWSVEEKKVSVFIDDSAHANGMYFDKNDNLYVCEGGTGSIVSYTPEGKRTVVANKFGDRSFNKPNDLWIDPKGGIYFTDPVYGQGYQNVQGGEHVYYILPDRSKTIRVIEVSGKEGEFVKPNGILGTPDGKLLYVADINGKVVYRYNIQPDGTLTDKFPFAPVSCDGMTIDEKGNVYLTDMTKGDLAIYSSDGKEIERISVPERPANVCFGGKEFKTLFITARKGFYSIEMSVKGAGLPEPLGVGRVQQMVELQIGEKPFMVKFLADGNPTLTLTMFVRVAQADQARFQREYEAKENTILDQITVVLRATTEAERREPSLTAIKDKAKKAINEVLGTPLVQEVLLANVRYESF